MTLGVLRAAVVPAAPLLLPSVSPDQPAWLRPAVAALRRDAGAAIGALPAASVAILLAASHPVRGRPVPDAGGSASASEVDGPGEDRVAGAGGRSAGPGGGAVHAAAHASMRPLGADAAAILPVPAGLARVAAQATGLRLEADGPLGLDLSALALQVRAVLGEVPVLPVAVPAGAAGERLHAVGTVLAGVLERAGIGAVVLCCGDLSSSLRADSPGYVVPGAAGWDAAVVHAWARDRLERLLHLGPGRAGRVGARGWAPLVVLHGMFGHAGLRPGPVTYRAPRGVGQVVARGLPRTSGPRDGRGLAAAAAGAPSP